MANPWIWGPPSGSGVQQLLSMLQYVLYVCICIYYTVYIAVFTHIHILLHHICHPQTPADICRPQIGPDFRGFGMFSWMSCSVTCCYIYIIHTYTPHIPCTCVRMCVIHVIHRPTPSSAAHHHPQTLHGVPLIARIPRIYTYYAYVYMYPMI